MYRLLMTYIILVLSCLFMDAQEIVQGTWSPLLDKRVVSVKCNFAHAIVESLSFDDFVKNEVFMGASDYQRGFENDKRDIIAEFIEEFNDTNSSILLSINPAYETLLTINVKEISRKGNAIACDYVFSCGEGTTPFLTVSMFTKNGRVGSFTNLMGDAFEKAGKNLGKYSKKMLKAENKKRTKL